MARNTVPNTVCSEHLFRTSFRTLSQNHPQDHQKHTYKEPPKGGCAPLGGLLIGVLLMVLEVVLVVLEVVLVVLEVTGPQVPWGVFQIRLSLRPDLYFPAPPIGSTFPSGGYSLYSLSPTAPTDLRSELTWAAWKRPFRALRPQCQPRLAGLPGQWEPQEGPLQPPHKKH